MKKNCIMIHGCPSDREKAMDAKTRTYDKHWMPWLGEMLMKDGFEVERPLMPDPWAPVYEKYKQEFEKHEVTKKTVLIGHSCGCSFLVRWLGETKKEIKKLILVAPWKINAEASQLEKEFYEFNIDRTIVDRVEKIVFFTSDNEEEDGKKGLKMFHDAIGGEIIDLKNHGHFVSGHMGTNEFPEILDVVIS